MSRHLVVSTTFGLCNRLISLANYSVIARHTNRRLRSLWPASPAVCGTEFNQVYRNDLIISPEELAQISAVQDTARLEIGYGVHGKSGEDLARINSIPDLEAPLLVVTTSCYFLPDFIGAVEFHTATRAFLLGLEPVPAIRRAVEDFTATHEIHPDNPRVMGVHIRRTDREESIRVSSDLAFRERIDRELDCDPHTRFFLATDCETTLEKFRSRYGDRLIVYPKTFDRRHAERPNSLASAVTELHILARTHFIYGSYASSFSKVASILRGTSFYQTGFL
jgi:hypothetical protein